MSTRNEIQVYDDNETKRSCFLQNCIFLRFHRRIFSRCGALSQRGALSLEMLGILMIMGMFIAFAARQGDQTRQAGQAAALASQLNMLSKGAQTFMDSNSSQLLSKLNTSGIKHLKINMNDVRNNYGGVVSMSGDANSGLRKYLPVTFTQTRFKQDPVLYVFKGPDGSLHGLFATTNGIPKTGTAEEKKRYLDIARTAASINGFGMMMEKNASGNVDVNAIVGNKNSWRYNFPVEDDIPRLENGQLGRIMFSYGAAVKDNMLYRSKVDGHPELNAMQTDLHMNGNQISNTGTITISQNPIIKGSPYTANVPSGGNGVVIEPANYSNRSTYNPDDICAYGDKPNGFIFTFSSGDLDKTGLWMCMKDPGSLAHKARLIADSRNSTLFKSAIVAAQDEEIKKPVCPNNTTPAIYVAPAAFAETADKPSSVVAVQTLAEDAGDKWRVKIRLKTTKNVAGAHGVPNAWTDAKPSDRLNFAIVHTTCERKR